MQINCMFSGVQHSKLNRIMDKFKLFLRLFNNIYINNIPTITIKNLLVDGNKSTNQGNLVRYMYFIYIPKIVHVDILIMGY